MKKRGFGGLIFLAVIVAAAVIWWGTAERSREIPPAIAVDPATQASPPPADKPEGPIKVPAPPLGEVQKLQNRQVFETRPWSSDAANSDGFHDQNSPASPAVLSPKGRLKAFLSPVEFETVADVYVEDASSASKWQLQLSLDKTLTPTRLAWLDEKRFFVIVAYAYGTTSLGGDVYLVDALTGRGALWYKPARYCQVTEVAVSGNRVELTVVRFNVNYDEHTTQKVVLDRPQ